MSATPLPCGTWPSPLSAADLTRGVRSFLDLRADGAVLYWCEARPEEGGRVAVMRSDGAEIEQVSPDGFSARTSVHEYGGGALAVRDGVVIASSWDDQRVHLLAGGTATPLTAAPSTRHGRRYGALTLGPGAEWFVAVRETHAEDRPESRRETDEAVDEIVLVDLASGDEQVLASGRDFYDGLWVSPDGGRLAFMCWDHPDMPWDGAELWELDVTDAAGSAHHVAGGAGTSIADATWLPDGRLAWLDDPDGWWNPFVRELDGTVTRVAEEEVECGSPRWQVGDSALAALTDGRLVVARKEGAARRLHVVGEGSVPGTWSFLRSVCALGAEVAVLAAAPTSPLAVVVVDAESGASRVVRDSGLVVGEGLVAAPEPLTFPTGPDPTAVGAPVAHAWWYPPRNPDARVPESERPPVLVLIHGGPTGATVATPRPDVLYWTSRGIGVVDVDYRGSTGYGRAYREALQGGWGIVDVEDCVAAVGYLAARGDVDATRALIRGGSAGGYTTLMALCTTTAFAAGTSMFGVADVAALAAHTHSFESRYMDGLMGASSADDPDLWRARSPLGNLDGLRTPTLVEQGLEDAVVPPTQAEAIVAALRERGVTHAYLAFAGEQHGFRQASTIVRALEAELAFYGHVLGFEPADEGAVLPELVEPG